MTVGDFTALTLGVERQEEPEPEHPFEANKRLFNSHIRFRPDDTEYHRSLTSNVCRYDERGKHIVSSKSCPHFEVADEQGPRIRDNWTIQQDRRRRN